MSTAKDKAAVKGAQKPAEIIQMLVTRPARIESADINTWTNAVNQYKHGNRTQLNDLYENLLSDPVLSSALDRRVMAITNAEITFQREGKNVKEMDDLIDTPEFEELISEIALSRAYGKSVIETSFDPEFGVFSIPRKHIKILNLHLPLGERKKYIVEREGNVTGYEYTLDEYFIECGKDTDLGYLFRAAQYVIYKRGGFGDWAQFAEIFGMPFLIGKYNSYDTDSRDKLFEALGQIGSNPRAAIPKETELDVKENKSSGSNNLYKDFRSACNEEILIAVLGNTMTTVSGSSRSQGEVHMVTQQGIANSDRRFVQRMLNKKFLPLLEKRGYPVSGGSFTFPDKGENMTAAERVELAITIKDAGIPVSEIGRAHV